MCSHFRSIESRSFGIPPALALAATFVLTATLVGCNRGPISGTPAEQPDQLGVFDSALTPGVGHSLVVEDPRAQQYYDSPQAVTTGSKLFKQYNCNGCHSSGGGGMGVDLMDGEWIYGSRLTQIHQTLVEGRPNGMPAWGGKIPDQQLWELAAYVRSLSLPQTLAANADDTPGQMPAPVPAAADGDAGWSPPLDTTNPYGTTLEGPAYEGPTASDTSQHQPPASAGAPKATAKGTRQHTP